MARIALSVVFDVDEGRGNVEELARDIVEHIVDEYGELRRDFGPLAWGGYPGPVITEATLLEAQVW